ncbi:hypothetical protein GGF37_005567 [Kickxella alabastrina]|nr:hypothetical protein GGF37_005567 [Kickxella alabastrina]
MLKFKRIFDWCAKHKGSMQSRRGTPGNGSRIFSRRRSQNLAEEHIESARRHSEDHNVSMETLVDEKHRTRAFSEPDISEYQHEYSYYPWSESEHEEILSRSPAPLRPHYATFPSLVEMGGFMSI